MEWIILDDGTDKVADLFDPKVTGLKNVKYVALPEGVKLPIGAKRNRLNEMAKGDIVVCWDDDDYYPPERVQKAVFKLRSYKGKTVSVVGSSKLHLYFSDRDEIWTIGPYNPNHCTNGTMAYWRSYFGPNRYDDTAEKAEEKKFMQGFTIPVGQLTSEETMLVICHAHNTFDKRILLKQNNPMLKTCGTKMRQLVKDKKIRDFYLELARDYKELDARVAAEEAAKKGGAGSGPVAPASAPAAATAPASAPASAAAPAASVVAATAAAAAEPEDKKVTDSSGAV